MSSIHAMAAAAAHDNFHMDEASAALIIELELQDSQQLYEQYEGRGKGRAGSMTDSQVAINLYIEDLRRNASIVADRQMSKSIARACQDDAHVIADSVAEERMAVIDRRQACHYSGVKRARVGFARPLVPTEVDDECLSDLSKRYMGTLAEKTVCSGDLGIIDITQDEENSEVAESSSWGASRRRPWVEHSTCVACQDEIRSSKTVKAPCNHDYCEECLLNLFRSSYTDESLFPPKCCRQSITIPSVRRFLNVDLIEQYEEKMVEFSTENRVYCSGRLCSAFIRPEFVVDERATCMVCGTATCTLCKAGVHEGDCPADTGVQQVLQVAASNAWQRCYSCRNVVELEIGCNHITCRCQAEFCYICSMRWKTCRCPLWTENRLLHRANQVVARAPAHANDGQRIAEAAHNLRGADDCDHERWQRVEGAHQCEECFDVLRNFIFECEGCQIQACNRCRQNRL